LKTRGKRIEVCKRTFMKTFALTSSEIQYLQTRLQNGEIAIMDGRGADDNPHATSELIKNQTRAHIEAFQKFKICIIQMIHIDYTLNFQK
jgi:hypothetical protein